MGKKIVEISALKMHFLSYGSLWLESEMKNVEICLEFKILLVSQIVLYDTENTCVSRG